MQIYIMRHGEASLNASTDEVRELTDIGRKQTQQMASWLSVKLQGELDLVLVSPYVRAQQTWEVCQPLLPEAKKVLTEKDITPYGKSDTVAFYIRSLIGLEEPKNVLVISHLPLVGYLTAEFEDGLMPPMFSTSTIACIEYDKATEKSQVIEIKAPN